MTGAGPAAVPDTYAAYASGRPDPRFTDWLRQRAAPSFDAATDHQFVRELRADTLDDAVFRRYLVQDYAFLAALTGAFGHALGDAPTMAAKARLAEFLGTLTAEENDYFERSFDALDVPESAVTDPTVTDATAAFRDLLGRVSHEGGYAETLAVLVPAEWVYLDWAAGRVGDQSSDDTDLDRPDRFYLAEWIDLHAAPEFESFVDWLRRELDREGAAVSERRQGRLADLFARTVDLEVAFFDAAYEGGDGQW